MLDQDAGKTGPQELFAQARPMEAPPGEPPRPAAVPGITVRPKRTTAQSVFAGVFLAPTIVFPALAHGDQSHRIDYLIAWIVSTVGMLAMAVRRDDKARADRPVLRPVARPGGPDPAEIASLQKPIPTVQLWGLWLPLIVVSIGGMAYIWEHTDSSSRRSPAALAMLPLFLAISWKVRQAKPRTKPSQPGIAGFWAGLSRRDRLTAVKAITLVVCVAAYAVMHLVSA